MTQFVIRPERQGDIQAISQVTKAAFAQAAHSSHTEHFIVDALRREGALALSLVAEEAGQVLGHLALSPVTLSPQEDAWLGLGPISVQPAYQGRGIGAALMAAAIAEAKKAGAKGIVLLGDPAYYGRFGFRHYPGLVLPGVPAPYFQALVLAGQVPSAQVCYHSAFEAQA